MGDIRIPREGKLLEETDYKLELQRSMEVSAQCSHIPNLVFPVYYPELSSEKIITMDWLKGAHLKEFLALNPSQEVRDKISAVMARLPKTVNRNTGAKLPKPRCPFR